MNTFIIKYDRWICREAYRFIRRYQITRDTEDYIQTARMAACTYCQRKGITSDNLTTLTLVCIRKECFSQMWAVFCKKDGVGINRKTYKRAWVTVEPVDIISPVLYDRPYEDPDNTLLVALQSMVNEEWGEILQEIADGCTQTEVSQKHGISPQLLHYRLKRIGEVMRYGGHLSRGMRRIS